MYDTWRGLIAELVNVARHRGAPATSTGSLSAATYSTTDGDLVVPIDAWGVVDATGGHPLLFHATASADGDADILIVDGGDAALQTALGPGDMDCVVVRPGSLPSVYTRRPDRLQTRVSPTADPERVRDVAAVIDGAGQPAPAASIQRARSHLGRDLPADVVALYETTTRGVVHDLRVVGPDDIETRQWCSPEMRMASWTWGALAVAPVDPDRRVQALGSSSAWFVVGDDMSGGFFVVDMEPDVNGSVGQLLHIDRDVPAGAVWIADSFTDYVVRAPERPPVLPLFGDPSWGSTVTVDDIDGIDSVGPSVEVLRIHCGADLTPLRGHPRLRTLEISGEADGLDSLRLLPALEFVSMPVETWERALAGGHVPGGLCAVGFDGGEFVPRLRVANRVLALSGRPPLTAYRVTAQGHYPVTF